MSMVLGEGKRFSWGPGHASVNNLLTGLREAADGQGSVCGGSADLKDTDMTKVARKFCCI